MDLCNRLQKSATSLHSTSNQGEDRLAMLAMALNHMTMPTSSTEGMLDMAQALGCVGVELRNDLAAGLFDGADPQAIRDAVTVRGLRLLALAEVYGFNDNTDASRQAVRDLAALAVASGAEAIALIPRLGRTPLGQDAQRQMLQNALQQIRPVLEDHGIIGLIEPLGFANSTLRMKADCVAVLDAMARPACFAMIHDTFHHALAGEEAVFADLTRIVHVSGVTEAQTPRDALQDHHRGLVDGDDRLGNIDQIKQLRAQGYHGPLSFEAFAPQVHALSNPADALRGSTTFIASQLA